MELAIVAGEKRVRAPCKFTSVKWICHGHAKVFLALIEIFRPEASAARTLGGSDNHAVIEVEAVGRPDFNGAPDQVAIGRYEFDRRESVKNGEQLLSCCRL